MQFVPSVNSTKTYEVKLQVESEKNTASAVPTCHTPWFIVNVTVIQCSWFLMGMSIDPFLIDPFR